MVEADPFAVLGWGIGLFIAAGGGYAINLFFPVGIAIIWFVVVLVGVGGGQLIASRMADGSDETATQTRQSKGAQQRER